MGVFYYQPTNEKVEAEEVDKPHMAFSNDEGEIVVTQGNYIVTYADGRKIGVALEDFDVYYAKSKNKALEQK